MVQVPAGNPFRTTLPVATVHVGCVIKPKVGAVGVAGCAFIVILADAGDEHPTELVTVYEYVPAAKGLKLAVAVLPAIAPGFSIQFPDGKPVNTILPVATKQPG